MDYAKRIERLKEHLVFSKINHEDKIIECPSLKDTHIYCILQNISAQQFGPLIEKYIIHKFNYKKNSASDCIGDCVKNSENMEIKASLGGAGHTKFNYVQIRPSQDVALYLLTAYYLTGENVEKEGELYIFKVPKKDIKGIIVSFGGYAHGTVKEHGKITTESINDEKSVKEYAIRPSYNDACWNALLPFRVSESEL